MIIEVSIITGVTVIVPFLIKKFIFTNMEYEDTFQESAPHEIMFKKICLNAKLRITAIPGKQEAYFITYHSDAGSVFLLFHYNPFIKGMLKYNSRIDVKMFPLKKDDVIDDLLHQDYGDDFLFSSLKSGVIPWVLDNFYGYLNYSQATDILTDKPDHKSEPEEVPYTETELISKMLEAEKNEDKQLEHKLLDLWEKHFQNKKHI